MYEGLIVEIDKLRIDLDPTKVNSLFEINRVGHNFAIDQVIDLIKRAEPPITDKPLETGWHWWIPDGCGDLSDYHPYPVFSDVYGVLMLPAVPKGKWQKIVVCNGRFDMAALVVKGIVVDNWNFNKLYWDCYQAILNNKKLVALIRACDICMLHENETGEKNDPYEVVEWIKVKIESEG